MRKAKLSKMKREWIVNVRRRMQVELEEKGVIVEENENMYDDVFFGVEKTPFKKNLAGKMLEYQYQPWIHGDQSSHSIAR